MIVHGGGHRRLRNRHGVRQRAVYVFCSLIPDIAAGLHIPAVVMIMPMHFATTLARAVSPITAVIVVTYRVLPAYRPLKW